jgi:hypothetical protein
MKFIRILFFVITLWQFPAKAQIHYYNYFTDGILRIDYVRSGSALSEEISQIQLKTETFWSGCRTKTLQPFDYGEFKIEVYGASDSVLLFRHAYSSLFAEYLYTQEGITVNGSFEETVRMPFPKAEVKIVFFRRDKITLLWNVQHELMFDPAKEKLSPVVAFKQIDFKKLTDNGAPEKKVDVVFLAEGYTKSEKQKFYDDAKRVASYLLDCSPFNAHLSSFNVWAVFAPSEQTGVTDPSSDVSVNTITGCNFSTFGTDRYLMTEQHFAVRDMASVVPYDHIVILVNTDKYGGGGIYNFYATCPADCKNSGFLMIHEFGHSFAGLADEYYTSDVSVSDYYRFDVEPVEPNITTLVDFSKKWEEMIAEGTPVPTPDSREFQKTVGVFEGAGYSAKGIYRPYLECTMKSVLYNAFCPVCSSSIELVIDFFRE